jgi:hypothetical protein
MLVDELAQMFRLILGLGDTVMYLRIPINSLCLHFVAREVSSTDSTNACLTTFNLSHLPHKFLAIGSWISCFCCAMFQFTLQSQLQYVPGTHNASALAGSVE